MNTLTKLGLAAGAMTIATGVIISRRDGGFPVPAPGTKDGIMRDATTGKCWEVRSDGWTRPAPCPTPTRNVLPRVTP